MGRFEPDPRKKRSGSRHGRTEAAQVGSVVGQFLKRHPSFSTNPVGDWQELVGESMARYCQPQSLKKKVLTVTAHDSVWKYHLELLKGPLLEKINKGRNEPLVEKMVVRVGELRDVAPPLNPALQNLETKPGKAYRVKRKKTPTRSLSSDEKAMLKTLKDPELRAAGKRLLKRVPVESGE